MKTNAIEELNDMLYRRTASARKGSTLVESALVLPGFFVLTLGLLVAGMGVARYNEVAYIARETARYASVHGAVYAQTNPSAPAVNQAALVTYASSRASTVNISKCTVTVQMTCFAPGATATSPTPPATSVYNWDDTTNNANHSPFSVWTDTATGTTTTADNVVTVTITYPWVPETFLSGPINLSSTAVIAMSY
jgi:Flp pilus assembly protein TadG